MGTNGEAKLRHVVFEEDKKEQENFDSSIELKERRQYIRKVGVPTRCEIVIERVETHLINSLSAESSPRIFGEERNLSSLEETLSKNNIRIAVVGNVDAGTSTLIGTLTTSMLDDGRGKSRTAIMRHRHETEARRTSTAMTHLLGF